MAKVDIKIEKDNTKAILSAEQKAVVEALTMIGLLVESNTKALTPVDTGNLRNSFTNQVQREEKAVYIGTNVEYAPYIEYGHRVGTSNSFYQGRYMLRDAINNNQREINSIIEQKLRNS